MYYGKFPISAPTATTVPTSTTNVNNSYDFITHLQIAYSFLLEQTAGGIYKYLDSLLKHLQLHVYLQMY